jgi:hypothetical protein
VSFGKSTRTMDSRIVTLAESISTNGASGTVSGLCGYRNGSQNVMGTLAICMLRRTVIVKVMHCGIPGHP